MAEIKATLSRIESQIGPADYELLKGLVGTITVVMQLLRAQRTTIARLRRFFGFSSSEKTSDVLAKGKAAEAANAAVATAAELAAAQQPAVNPEPATKAKPKVKGHGRLPATDYEAATQFAVTHESLQAGDSCPDCGRGTLYELSEPTRIVRITGQPLLAARCWNCQRLRCSGCGHVYTAQAPAEAQGPKFDETAVSMLALCRYSIGLPHHRLERMQNNLQTPIPSSTQWDVLNENASVFQPVFTELCRQAAQGEIVHNDDTFMRILALMGKSRATLLKAGTWPDPERTGLFTTAIVSLTNEQPLVVFCTGRKYAGENLGELLKARALELEPPILMADGLDSRNIPKGRPVLSSNCLVHARRNFVDQHAAFPVQCEHVIEQLGKIFAVDARCKEERLSPTARLRTHQCESRPVMDALHTWMTEELATKRTEPNSGLGQAYNYMLKRWPRLTLFLRKPGAPIDNNICERALKMAICHRRNSRAYRTEHGANLGDLFMSLIHTAELRNINPFDYLTEVQRHSTAAADNPADWLPWTYLATLDRMNIKTEPA